MVDARELSIKVEAVIHLPEIKLWSERTDLRGLGTVLVVLMLLCYIGCEVIRIGFKAFWNVLVLVPAAAVAVPAPAGVPTPAVVVVPVIAALAAMAAAAIARGAAGWLDGAAAVAVGSVAVAAATGTASAAPAVAVLDASGCGTACVVALSPAGCVSLLDF